MSSEFTLKTGTESSLVLYLRFCLRMVGFANCESVAYIEKNKPLAINTMMVYTHFD